MIHESPDGGKTYTSRPMRDNLSHNSSNNSEAQISKEISDEEIEEEISKRYMHPTQDYAWRDACKWYREQL